MLHAACGLNFICFLSQAATSAVYACYLLYCEYFQLFILTCVYLLPLRVVSNALSTLVCSLCLRLTCNAASLGARHRGAGRSGRVARSLRLLRSSRRRAVRTARRAALHRPPAQAHQAKSLP